MCGAVLYTVELVVWLSVVRRGEPTVALPAQWIPHQERIVTVL